MMTKTFDLSATDTFEFANPDAIDFSKDINIDIPQSPAADLVKINEVDLSEFVFEPIEVGPATSTFAGPDIALASFSGSVSGANGGSISVNAFAGVGSTSSVASVDADFYSTDLSVSISETDFFI